MGLKNTRFYRFVSRAFARMREERIDLYSAHAAFFLVISMIPLLMLLITLFQIFFPATEETLTVEVLGALPESFRNFFQIILSELFSKKTVPIISVSALILLWSASRGVLSVMRGLRHIYRAKSLQFYRERVRALVYTVALVLTLLFALVVLVFGDTVLNFILSNVPWLEGSSALIIAAKFLVSALLISLFSILIYTSMAPKPYNTLRVQFPGALFTAAGWILFSTGFSLYINNFSNYSYIYGSLAAIILLMLWLYICMWLLFLGAVINSILYRRKNGN